MDDTTDLLADPIYQLNFALWMLQPMPRESPITPVLFRAGYMLDSLSRPLPLPPAIRPALFSRLGNADPPAPDILAEPARAIERLVIECKGNSFTLASSSSAQLIKLLAVGADLSGPLGLPAGTARPAHVAYLMPGDKADAQAETITEATADLQKAGMTPAAGSVIAMSRREDGVYVEARGPARLPSPVADEIGSGSRVLAVQPGEDVHLLYLIPWDPSVEQTKSERDRCKAILFSKVAAAAVAEIGRAEIPQRVSLVVHTLLAAATYGVSNKWRDRSSIEEVQRQCATFIADAVKRIASLEVSLPGGPRAVQLTLSNEDTRTEAIEAILEADPMKIPDTRQISWLDSGA